MITYYSNKWGALDEKIPVSMRRKCMQQEYYKQHWHEYFEIEFWLSGKAYSYINGKKYEIKKGTVYLLSTADFHDITVDLSEKAEIIHACIDRTMLDIEFAEKIYSADKTLFFQLSDEEFDEMYRLLSLGVEQWINDGEYKIRYLKNIFENVVILLMRKCELPDVKEKYNNTYVTKVMAYLGLHFRRDISLEEVASFLGLNKNYFCTLFKKETGMTMHSYLNDLRLKYAKKLLTSTDLSVSEICKSCGFNSFANFSNAFKQKYGMTPNKYRMNSKSD